MITLSTPQLKSSRACASSFTVQTATGTPLFFKNCTSCRFKDEQWNKLHIAWAYNDGKPPQQTEFVNTISSGLLFNQQARPSPQPAPTPAPSPKPKACDTSLVFSVGSGNLQILIDGNIYEVINADSGTNKKGNQCLNNSSCQERKSEGPIPIGNYSINAGKIYSLGLFGIAKMNRPNFVGGGDWGSFRVEITPQDGTNVYGRSGFFLHGGKFQGSAGCIDVGGGWLGNEITEDLLKILRRDRDSIIPLRVIK